MDPKTPMVVAAARYRDRADAVADFKDMWDAEKIGNFDHLAVAVLTKDEHGDLQLERHDTSAKHLAWGGALLGAALVVVAPPAGVSTLATIGGAAGAGGLVGHLWRNIPKDLAQEAGELLESGESGLLVVGVNPAIDVASMFGRADRTKVITTVAGDLDAVIDRALRDAQANDSA